MSSRSARKFIARTSSYYSFKEKVAVGQWVSKLNKKQCTMDEVPVEIQKMIRVDKPDEVAVEEAADTVEPAVEEHVHTEHCNHNVVDV